MTAEDPDDSWGEEWTDEDERALDDEEAERRRRLLAVANKSTEPTVDTVIFDTELTPRQNRNIEQFLDGKVQVCDRTMLILDIFSQRARTAEGQLQVEMAQLEYQLPRLSRMWTHLERQTGGGGAGGQVKGMGEKQIEIDKRLLRDRIQFLKKKVDKVKTHRSLYRERRKETPVPVISLVGYTNAGKSSLLNVLTAAEVYAENQLFATLDPTTRRFPLPNGKEVLVTDTVGFIQNLPTELVAAFRATLEEIVDSTMLIHVVDISSPLAGAQVAAVESVLKDLGASDIPRITVWNKADARPGVDDLNILATKPKPPAPSPPRRSQGSASRTWYRRCRRRWCRWRWFESRSTCRTTVGASSARCARAASWRAKCTGRMARGWWRTCRRRRLAGWRTWRSKEIQGARWRRST